MNMLSGNESKLFRNELEIVLEREEWIDAVIEWQSRSGQVVLFRSLLPPQKNGWEMDNARGGVITPQVPMTFFFPAIILPLRFDWPLSPIFSAAAEGGSRFSRTIADVCCRTGTPRAEPPVVDRD